MRYAKPTALNPTEALLLCPEHREIPLSLHLLTALLVACTGSAPPTDRRAARPPRDHRLARVRVIRVLVGEHSP